MNGTRDVVPDDVATADYLADKKPEHNLQGDHCIQRGVLKTAQNTHVITAAYIFHFPHSGLTTQIINWT